MALSNLNRTKQAGDLINEVGVEVGLPKISDPFVSTDPQYQRLITLLNIAGNNLIDLYPWSRFTRILTIPLLSGQGSYDLPNDFLDIIPGTMWQPNVNLTPAYGSVTPQTWQMLLSIPLVGTLQIIYRERSGKLDVLPVPTSNGITVTVEYQSRAWVEVSGQATRDNVTQYSDVVLHDPALISRYLKMKFLEAVGFDTQKATDDFNLILDARTSKDQSRPILSMSGPYNSTRLLDVRNLPETGYG
jgi:hypothetical protein